MLVEKVFNIIVFLMIFQYQSTETTQSPVT